MILIYVIIIISSQYYYNNYYIRKSYINQSVNPQQKKQT